MPPGPKLCCLTPACSHPTLSPQRCLSLPCHQSAQRERAESTFQQQAKPAPPYFPPPQPQATKVGDVTSSFARATSALTQQRGRQCWPMVRVQHGNGILLCHPPFGTRCRRGSGGGICFLLPLVTLSKNRSPPVTLARGLPHRLSLASRMHHNPLSLLPRLQQHQQTAVRHPS